MRCLDLAIFYRCVNRCVFCSNAERMRDLSAERPSPDEIAAELERRRAEGFGHVTFTGGEPTLYPRVWEVLRRAKELGYRTQVVTNGAAFATRGFARRTLPFVDELCLSALGDGAAVHDAMTRRPGSFDVVLGALDETAAYEGDLRMTFNAAATRLNAERLEALAALAARHPKAREFWVSALIPEGEALARYSELSLPYARVMERAAPAARAAERGGLRARFFGFPDCVLGADRPLASERFKHPGAAVGLRRDGGRARLGEIPPDEGPRRVKPARCADCAWKASCAGAWERHLDEYGEEEVTPWTA